MRLRIGAGSDAASHRKSGSEAFFRGLDEMKHRRLKEAEASFAAAEVAWESVPGQSAHILMARGRRAASLSGQLRYDEALDLLEDVCCAPAQAQLSLDEQALFRSGRVVCLRQLSRLREADSAAQSLIEGFRLGDSPKQRGIVASMMIARGRIAEDMGHYDRAFSCYDDAMRFASEFDEPRTRRCLREADDARSALAGRVRRMPLTDSGADVGLG